MNESSFIFLFYLNKGLNYLNKVKASEECQRFWSIGKGRKNRILYDNGYLTVYADLLHLKI